MDAFKPMGPIRLYFRYVRVLFRGALGYRGWWMAIPMVLLTCLTDPMEIYVLFSRFGTVGGFGFARVAMVYGWALSAFGMSELLARGLDVFPARIGTGAFDRILLRPRSTFLQAMTLQFHIHRVARVLFGLGLALFGIAAEGVPLTAADIAMLALSYLSGTTVYICVFLLQSAVCFVTIGAVDIAYVFTNGSYQNAKIPPNTLPVWLRRFFTFVMPMFVFCYYPFSAAFGWGDAYYLGWLAAPAALVFLAFSLLMWRLGVRRYSSSGS